MTCLTCTHSAGRDSADAERDRTLRAMADLGLINCTLSPMRASFRAFDSQCGAFKPLDARAAQARIEWRASRAAVSRETMRTQDPS